MFCKKCGRQVDSTAMACPHCGRAVDSLSGGTGFWDLYERGSVGRDELEASRAHVGDVDAAERIERMRADYERRIAYVEQERGVQIASMSRIAKRLKVACVALCVVAVVLAVVCGLNMGNVDKEQVSPRFADRVVSLVKGASKEVRQHCEEDREREDEIAKYEREAEKKEEGQKKEHVSRIVSDVVAHDDASSDSADTISIGATLSEDVEGSAEYVGNDKLKGNEHGQ